MKKWRRWMQEINISLEDDIFTDPSSKLSKNFNSTQQFCLLPCHLTNLILKIGGMENVLLKYLYTLFTIYRKCLYSTLYIPDLDLLFVPSVQNINLIRKSPI